MALLRDPLFFTAADFVVSKNQCSPGLLQRKFQISYFRAANIIEQLEQACVVGAYDPIEGRKIMADHHYIGELKQSVEEPA